MVTQLWVAVWAVLKGVLEALRTGVEQLLGLKKGITEPVAAVEAVEAKQAAAAAVREEVHAEAVAAVEEKVEAVKAQDTVEVANEIIKRRRGRPVGSKDSKPRARKR